MNNELKNINRPWIIRIFWAIVYVVVIVSFSSWAFATTGQIKNHTLPNGLVELGVPYSKYTVGETISFTIKNNYNSSIYVINNCPDEPLAVYRQENGSWVRLHFRIPTDQCPGEQRIVSILPGQTISGNFSLWSSLFNQPGKYRIVAFVEYYNSLPYQDIEVVDTPKPTTNPTPTPTQTPSANEPDGTSTAPTAKYESDDGDGSGD